MTYGPPGNPPPGPPPGGYGPPPGAQGPPSGGYGAPQGGPGQPQGGYGQPAPGYGAPQPGYGQSQGGYGAPQGGYGQPGPGYGAAKSGFDPKTVNPLDWAAMAAGVLAFIFSFVQFYKAVVDTSGSCPPSISSAISANSDTESAWHGFFGWFGTILALAGAAIVAMAIFAPQIKLPVPARLAACGAFALGALSTLLALVVDPVNVPGKESFGGCTLEPSIGHGIGYWVSLIVIVAGAVVTYLRFQQTGGQLPGRSKSAPPAYGGAAGYGQPGYQQPSYQPPPQQGPPPGYQPPPPPQSYQPPPPPQQQSYQPPPPQGGYPPPPQQQSYEPPPQQQPPPPPPQEESAPDTSQTQVLPGYQPPPPQGGYPPPPQPGYQPPPEQ